MCAEDDVKPGTMREVPIGERRKKKALLVRTQAGELHAVSNKCT